MSVFAERLQDQDDENVAEASKSSRIRNAEDVSEVPDPFQTRDLSELVPDMSTYYHVPTHSAGHVFPPSEASILRYASSEHPGYQAEPYPMSNDPPHLLEQSRKPQCWDHGCNGRTFSTFRNLRTHKRENPPILLEPQRIPQCWDHGCNGRSFSTFSNLLRHQREKSVTFFKSTCHRCGAEFTRKSARDGHLAHDKCKSRAENSHGNPGSTWGNESIKAQSVSEGHTPRTSRSHLLAGLRTAPQSASFQGSAPTSYAQHTSQYDLLDLMQPMVFEGLDSEGDYTDAKRFNDLPAVKTVDSVNDENAELRPRSPAIKHDLSHLQSSKPGRQSNVNPTQESQDALENTKSARDSEPQTRTVEAEVEEAIRAQWLDEHHAEPPSALWQSDRNVRFRLHEELNVSDKIKGCVENFSGRSWDWWPLLPPRSRVEKGKWRISWRCRCGDQLYVDASPPLAKMCARLRTLTTGYEVPSKNTPPTVGESTEGDGSRGRNGSLSGFSAGNTGQDKANASSRTGQTGSEQNQPTQKNLTSLFILFGINQSSKIDHTQIETLDHTHDDARFFQELRCQYRHLRGIIRYWLSPFIFSHCSFVRYTRFYVNELAYVGPSLPIDPTYVYNPRPPGPHEDPPISAHEFNRRFYSDLCNPCGRAEAFGRIPKRIQRFQTHLHVDGREDMWGLQMELIPSFFRIMLWQIAITSGGWALMAWWLMKHPGDLQGAAAPVTIISAAIVALWVPLWEKMK